jgi:alanine racemase
VNLDAVVQNLGVIRKAAGGAGVIAVVKANAYGHGAIEVARALTRAGAGHLGVAFASEARELRESGIKAPIILLFDTSDPGACFDLSLKPVLHDLKAAKAFSAEAARRGVTLGVHIKVDTGMGRMGFGDLKAALAGAALPGLRVEGLMSHLADADTAGSEFTRMQVERFREAAAAFAKAGMRPMLHLANSAGTLRQIGAAFDAVRPGLALYGVSPSGDDQTHGLRPAMRVESSVIAVRDLPKGRTVSYGMTHTTNRPTRAAVIAAGYADGYMRAYSNRAAMLIRGMRAPVIGRVCMDLTITDVTDIPEASAGDRAVLLGSDGGNTVSAWDLADAAGTVPYEVLLNFGRRGRTAEPGQ